MRCRHTGPAKQVENRSACRGSVCDPTPTRLADTGWEYQHRPGPVRKVQFTVAGRLAFPSRKRTVTLGTFSNRDRHGHVCVGEPLSAAHAPSLRLSAVPTIDTEQHMDIYETEINAALALMGIAGVPALREHQASATAHALHNEHVFLALATGAGKSLCFQIPAIIRAHHQQRVTVVLQPTLEIITSQVRALSAYGIDVEIISSLTSHEEKGSLAVRLSKDGPVYRPALIYTTSESSFSHHNYVFTTLLPKGALARVVLDEGHPVLRWAGF